MRIEEYDDGYDSAASFEAAEADRPEDIEPHEEGTSTLTPSQGRASVKTLYFVALYSHRSNEWARVLCTEVSVSAAARNCELAFADVSDGRLPVWRARTVRAICQTTDDIWTEV